METKKQKYDAWLNIPGNRELKNAKSKEWRDNNKQRIKEYKEGYLTPEVRASDYAVHVEWKKRNPERIKVYNKRAVEKTNSNPAALKRKEIRRIIYDGLKSKAIKSHLLEELIGCSKQHFKAKLEESFKDGMSWGNYGSYWQIDHVRPLILFDVLDDLEYRKSSHYSNLQPLLSVDNMKKGSKYNEEQLKAA